MPERVLFVILFVASIWAFAHTLVERFKSIKGKKFKFPDRIGTRIWRVISEVLLQSRVIKNRPLVGLMHAAVMWGFIAFSLVTMKHILSGILGYENFSPEVSDWLATIVAAFAVFTLIGIIGLSYRRFISRPSTLGKLSPSSGMVAFLIVLLMVTFLLNWKFFQFGSASWRISWWLHSLALLGFLWVIPRSKHLHLVLAPLTIFLRSDTTSSVRALDLENEEIEDLGLRNVSEMTAKDILDVNSCVECGRCTDVCPANLIGQTLNPKEIILQMQRGLLAGGGLIAGTQEEVTQGKTWITEDDVFQCLSCGACEQACPVGIEHVGMKILDIRRGLVSDERTENELLDQFFGKMIKTPHNPWGFPHDMRYQFITDEKFPIFDGSQEWLFWLGCGNSYDPHGQAVAVAMKTIMESAGVSYGVLENETCCGEPARRAGNEMLFLELSPKLIHAFQQKKVKRMVTCCPHCTTMLSKDYMQVPEFVELGIEVVHHTEFIAGILGKLQLKSSGLDVTMHDSCYMARGRNIVDEPRRALKASGANIKEMKRNRKETFCCGAGGAQIFIPDESIPPEKRVNRLRWNEAEATGASIIAVECPYCPVMLKDAALSAESSVEVLDIAEIVASQLVQPEP